MPTWLIVAVSLLAATGLLAGVAFVACWPYLRATPKQPWMADPSGKRDTFEYGGCWTDG